MTENVAVITQYVSRGNAEAKYMTMSYDEIIHPENRKKEKTGDEIVAEVFEKLGLEVCE